MSIYRAVPASGRCSLARLLMQFVRKGIQVRVYVAIDVECDEGEDEFDAYDVKAELTQAIEDDVAFYLSISKYCDECGTEEDLEGNFKVTSASIVSDYEPNRGTIGLDARPKPLPVY